MTDYMQLACSAKETVAMARRLECDIVADDHEALADALLACQRERDEALAECAALEAAYGKGITREHVEALQRERDEARAMQRQHRQANEGLVGRIAELANNVDTWEKSVQGRYREYEKTVAALEAESDAAEKDIAVLDAKVAALRETINLCSGSCRKDL
jgi:chromosome segregation ATPase